MFEFNSIREKLRNRELKIKRREVLNSSLMLGKLNAWERCCVMIVRCYINSTVTRRGLHIWHVKGTVPKRLCCEREAEMKEETLQMSARLKLSFYRCMTYFQVNKG